MSFGHYLKTPSLLRATAMFGKKAEKYVETRIGPSRTLGEERKKHVPAALIVLIGDPKVEIKLCHRSQPHLE
jgi:hypothetical protein